MSKEKLEIVDVENREITVLDRKVSLTPEQVDLLQKTICKDHTPEQVELFVQYCQAKGLDPFGREVYSIIRKGRPTFQIGIDGLRSKAEESGEYDGQATDWCGEDGVWKNIWISSQPPYAARVEIWRRGCQKPFIGIALWTEYKPSDDDWMWRKMPSSQLAKCFSSDTEILTEHGFKKFPDVGVSRVMQASDNGLEPIAATPFMQKYLGPMVICDGDMLNFCVTPNHDMITTVGKVEAGAMLATTVKTHFPTWKIPMIAQLGTKEFSIEDEDLRLAGYIAADGWHNGYRLFNISVSKEHKLEALQALAPYSRHVVHCKGAVAVSEARNIRSNFDKVRFVFPSKRVEAILNDDKTFNIDSLLQLSWRQSAILLEAWQKFDGHTNKKTGVRRIYTSRLDHVGAVELLAVKSGLCVSARRERTSDISDKPNYYLTLSSSPLQPVLRPAGRHTGKSAIRPMDYSGEVWCVKVPSGKIIVRRNGFSMVCGNCAEAIGLRKAFPRKLGGLYSSEEMQQADSGSSRPKITMPKAKVSAKPVSESTDTEIVESEPEEFTEPPVGAKQEIDFPEQSKDVRKYVGDVQAALEAQKPLSMPKEELEKKLEPPKSKFFAALHATVRKKGLSDEKMKAAIKVLYNKESSKDLTDEETSKLIKLVEKGGVR